LRTKQLGGHIAKASAAQLVQVEEAKE
jgi:hypothetical protein